VEQNNVAGKTHHVRTLSHPATLRWTIFPVRGLGDRVPKARKQGKPGQHREGCPVLRRPIDRWVNIGRSKSICYYQDARSAPTHFKQLSSSLAMDLFPVHGLGDRVPKAQTPKVAWRTGLGRWGGV
jgi:hypothetical protein